MLAWRLEASRKSAVCVILPLAVMLASSCGGESTSSSTILPQTEPSLIVDGFSTSGSPVPSPTIDPITERLAFGQPFSETFDPSVLPPLPEEFEGFTRYEGPDASGLSGAVRKALLTLYWYDDSVTPVYEFSSQMNNCEDSFWVLRWKAQDPNVVVRTSPELDGVTGADLADGVGNTRNNSGSAGLMSNSICFQPGFMFQGARDDLLPPNVEIELEWSFFDRDEVPNRSSGVEPLVCSQYLYDDELPIAPCSKGYSVTLFQEAIGIEPDGFFGPGMQRAVLNLRRDFGLPEALSLDAQLWRRLGVLSGAPYPDLNGDGVIDGSEAYFD